MTYPPRKQAPPNQADEFQEFGGPLPEVIPPPGNHVNRHDLVHFDIDPQNIFIFDPDAAHWGISKFKVLGVFRFSSLISFPHYPYLTTHSYTGGWMKMEFLTQKAARLKIQG